MRILWVLVAVALISAACSAADNATTTKGTTGTTPPNEFPLIALGHPDARFDGGVAGRSIHGSSVGIQWLLGPGIVGILVIEGGSENMASLVAGRLADPSSRLAEMATVRGHEAQQIVHAESDTHRFIRRFIWLEGTAVVEVRIVGVDMPVEEILASLIVIDEATLEGLTGGWLEEEEEATDS